MIVIVTYENYPDGSPGAIRCKSFAETYVKLGFEVVVIHRGQFEQNDNPVAISCYDSNRIKKYFGFSYKVIHCLDELKKSHTIQAVLTYGFFKSVNKWCRVNNVVNVVDIVEWYSKEQFKRWYLSYNYLNKQREIFNITKSKANVIAISSFLHDFFSNKGCKSVRIPIIVNDPINSNIECPDTDTLNLIYAGSHIVMDNILMVLRSLSKLTECERKKIRFSIYGLDKDVLMKSLLPSEQSAIENCVSFFGKRANNEIMEAYKNAHFTIFLRNPNLRVNKAGFPSKVVESMKMGVPVICNYSSDLDLYLVSDKNSIIVDKLSEDELCETFIKLLKLSQKDLTELRKNAISTVATKLCATNFSKEFTEIIY